MAIAKNYLKQDELSALNQIVSAYLEFAEIQARLRRPMHMAEWISKLDDFLRLTESGTLSHLGNVSHDVAAAKAELEFGRFEAMRRELEASAPVSDFDRVVDEAKKLERGRPALASQKLERGQPALAPKKPRSPRKPRKKTGSGDE